MAALPKSLCDREQDKFCEDSAGKTAVRVCADTDPLPVSGDFALAADGPIFPTGETVTDTSAGFPTTNQVGRAALSIRNIDNKDSIWVVRTSGITLAAAGDHVWEVGANETINTELTDSNKVFLVAESGKSVDVQILETKG